MSVVSLGLTADPSSRAGMIWSRSACWLSGNCFYLILAFGTGCYGRVELRLTDFEDRGGASFFDGERLRFFVLLWRLERLLRWAEFGLRSDFLLGEGDKFFYLVVFAEFIKLSLIFT